MPIYFPRLNVLHKYHCCPKITVEKCGIYKLLIKNYTGFMCYLTKVDNKVIPTPDRIMHLQTYTTNTIHIYDTNIIQ